MAPPSKYSPEFREEAVQIALRSSKTISEVARELELNSETLRELGEEVPEAAGTGP